MLTLVATALACRLQIRLSTTKTSSSLRSGCTPGAVEGYLSHTAAVRSYSQGNSTLWDIEIPYEVQSGLLAPGAPKLEKVYVGGSGRQLRHRERLVATSLFMCLLADADKSTGLAMLAMD